LPESGQIGSPKLEQFGFSHIDGSPIASAGRALTPHSGQIGDVSSGSMSSHSSLTTAVLPEGWGDAQAAGSAASAAADHALDPFEGS
jgi:hypothetical protein